MSIERLDSFAVCLFAGVSDPYVKGLHGTDNLFRTKEVKKTVNPMWAETHTVHIDNPFKPITFQVRSHITTAVN